MTDNKEQVKEVKAFARGIHMSPRKVRLVANLLKDLSVEEAFTNLEFITKKAVLPVKKLVSSAVANAKHNFQIETGRLFVKSLTVDAGQVMKRFKPRAQGRAFPIRRRTSNLSLILGVFEKARLAKRKIIIPERAEARDEKATEPPKPAEARKSRFSFLRRSRESDPTQVPPKQDAKGKHYTSFDRRAGE